MLPKAGCRIRGCKYGSVVNHLTQHLLHLIAYSVLEVVLFDLPDPLLMYLVDSTLI